MNISFFSSINNIIEIKDFIFVETSERLLIISNKSGFFELWDFNQQKQSLQQLTYFKKNVVGIYKSEEEKTALIEVEVNGDECSDWYCLNLENYNYSKVKLPSIIQDKILAPVKCNNKEWVFNTSDSNSYKVHVESSNYNFLFHNELVWTNNNDLELIFFRMKDHVRTDLFYYEVKSRKEELIISDIFFSDIHYVGNNQIFFSKENKKGNILYKYCH